MDPGLIVGPGGRAWQRASRPAGATRHARPRHRRLRSAQGPPRERSPHPITRKSPGPGLRLAIHRGPMERARRHDGRWPGLHAAFRHRNGRAQQSGAGGCPLSEATGRGPGRDGRGSPARGPGPAALRPTPPRGTHPHGPSPAGKPGRRRRRWRWLFPRPGTGGTSLGPTCPSFWGWRHSEWRSGWETQAPSASPFAPIKETPP